MKVHCYLPSWPGPRQHPEELRKIVEPFCPVTILDNPNHYFTDQWNEMLDQFLPSEAEVCFYLMADAILPKNFKEMYYGVTNLISFGYLGVYAPDISWTGQKFFKSKLEPFGGKGPHRQYLADIYHIPSCEMICWYIKREVLELMPRVDPKINKIGWGIEYLANAAAKRLGLATVRDYNFVVGHPKGANYDTAEGERQYNAWVESLPPDWRAEVRAVEAERDRLGVRLIRKIVGPFAETEAFTDRIKNESDLIITTSNPTNVFQDDQDVFWLYDEHPPEDFIQIIKSLGIRNLWFKAHLSGEFWDHWQHPKYETTAKEIGGIKFYWLLPQQLKERNQSGPVNCS